MNLHFRFILILLFCLWSSNAQAVVDNEALQECGNIHHLEFRNIPNAAGAFSNSQCMLKCSVGEKILSNDAINENFPCPTNPHGFCHNGQCIGSSTDAMRECGNMLHIDFHKVNSHGTLFTDSQCFLKCVINGTMASANAINEGYPCPENSNGICRNGHCVIGVTTSQPVTVQPVTPKPNSKLATNIIHDVGISVGAAHLHQNVSWSYVNFCLEDFTHGHGVKSEDELAVCYHFCSSHVDKRTTDKPEFRNHCDLLFGLSMNGRSVKVISEKNSLIVKVYHYVGGKVHLVGVFVETIGSLFERHHEKTSFEDKFALRYQGKQVGEIELKFDYRLRKNN